MKRSQSIAITALLIVAIGTICGVSRLMDELDAETANLFVCRPMSTHYRPAQDVFGRSGDGAMVGNVSSAYIAYSGSGRVAVGQSGYYTSSYAPTAGSALVLPMTSSQRLNSYGGGTSASASTQGNSSSMGSTSAIAYSSPAISIVSVGASSPSLVSAASGDIDPFEERAIRRGRGTTGSGEGNSGGQNPTISEPIGSAILPLLLMAVAYIIIRRKKHLRHCDMRQRA